MNIKIGDKLKYIGKSGQIKKGALVTFVEKDTDRPYTRCSIEGGRILYFSDADLVPAHIRACDLPLGFIQALIPSQVKIRVHWPQSKDLTIHQTFQENGLSLPSDARPLQQKEEQWDWSATVTFPALPENLTPEGTTKDSLGIMRNSRRDVVLALLKAGFSLTDYTRY